MVQRHHFSSLFVLASLVLATFAQHPLQAQKDDDEFDPFAKWNRTIEVFDEKDEENPPEKGQVLFLGSSTIRRWDLEAHFPQLDAINRGFGGSEIKDSNHFFDRLVTKHAPRQIVFYAGDNDVSKGTSPEQVRDDFREFVTKTHAALPETTILFLSIKPSPRRWKLFEKMDAANQMIKQDSEADPLVSYLDIGVPLLGEDGLPQKKFFALDRLHFSRLGNDVLANLVRPHLDAKQPLTIDKAEFLYGEVPFPSCHASTIEETPTGLVTAWFGGTAEKNPDVGIWVSRLTAKGWTDPVEVANGIQHNQLRYPTWNPVLFQQPNGPLQLYYKCGPSPSTWWGMLTNSTDGGETWSFPRRLPEGIDGPVKNKPILLADGTLLCGSSTEYQGWRVHFEKTKDFGKTWSRIDAINDGKTFGVIQPTILTHKDGRLQILCRAKNGGKIVTSFSGDQGETWGKLEAIDLPNPNSGIDAVTLQDGRHLVVYNHTPRGRSPLNIAISNDGKTWTNALTLESEPGEYSYPAVIQTNDGKIHTTYTWKRERIKHVVVDPTSLKFDVQQN